MFIVYVFGFVLTFIYVYDSSIVLFFFFSSRRRHTRCALVTGVQTCALPIFGEKGVLLQVTRPDAFGAFVSDRAKLRQILWRLLENAAKFTESGDRKSVV